MTVDEILLNSKDTDVSLPCNSCNGDCCGPVPFTEEDLTIIFNKYQKSPKFRKRFPYNNTSLNKNIVFQRVDEKIVPVFVKSNKYLKLGLDKLSCIFKDNETTGGCLIYEDRPIICRVYGKKELIPCPYAGLDKQPEDETIRKKLVVQNQLAVSSTMYSKFGIKPNIVFTTKKD